MKSRVFRIICGIGLLALISACSPQAAPETTDAAAEAATSETKITTSETPVTITWWVPNWDEDVVRQLLAGFESENPNIKVELVITTWDTMQNQIRLGLMSSNPPDLITELESRIPAYAAQGLLENLDQYMTSSEDLTKDDIITSALEINSYEGSLYGIPFRHDGTGIYYNKTMFENAGLDPENFPTTWNELMQASTKLTIDTNNDGTPDQYATTWPFGNQSNAVTRYILQLYSHGGDILSADEKVCTLDTPEAVEAMKSLVDTLTTNKIASPSSMEIDNTLLRELFINQKIAWYISGAFDIDTIRQEAPDLDLGTAVLPGVDGMGTTTVNGFSMIIPSGAANKDAAWKLADYIARTENMSQLTNTFPARKSALTLEKFSAPLLQPFAEQLEQGKSEPAYSQWAEMETIIYTYMQKALLNNITPEEAMTNITSEINAILQ